MGIVYIFTNKINGKKYVGQTIDPLNKRLNWHKNTAKRGDGFYFHSAIRKYGWENFIVYAREYPDAVLNEAETATIKSLGSKVPSGYNLTDGGDCGWTVSDETRVRMSQAHLGHKTGFTGKSHSDKTKRKMSKAHYSSKNHEAKPINLIHSGGRVEYFNCIMDAARKYNLCGPHLSAVAKGKREHHKGYRVRYA